MNQENNAGTNAPALNKKAVKTLNKLLEAGFADEKAIAGMTLEDIIAIPGITLSDITQINTLQKSIRANRILSFLCGSLRSE